jgi:hypothetical protein
VVPRPQARRRLFAAALLFSLVTACGSSERAVPVVTASPSAGEAETFDAIGRLLDRIAARYRAGARDEAAELAARAYLDNYEHLEEKVDAVDHELNEDLEHLLGTQLRAKIRARVAVSELDALVQRAKVLLARAKKAVLHTS